MRCAKKSNRSSRVKKRRNPLWKTPAFQKQMASLADGSEAISTELTGRVMGRYQVQEKIGAGGMGVVYRALDTRLGRTVALKVLPPDVTADPERRSRFVREAKAASALNHPNIITIFDIDRVDGIDFIAMEYIAGRTLQDIIARRELSAADAVNFAVQIVQALVAAHSAGIIHRDIKPANIMIAGYPAGSAQVKVLDFGLAKLTESAPSGDTLSEDMTKGSIIGTAAYMSPEQAEGKSIDARSDIFSFGSVLYEMLSGRRAFRGDSNLAILTAVLRETPEPVPGIPANLQNIVSRCLQKDPGLRIQSAVELKLALEACLPLSIASSSPVKTIAVLPFTNLSGDKENEYFSDGLTEEMISALTRLPGLRVTARTSAFALRGKNLDIREIGARLNVEHILEGSVRSSGNRVRVTAQVVNVADGYQLWSERYDREMRDVLDIQDEISHAIVDTLRVHLAKDISLVRRHTNSPEAYSLYLRGRHYQEKHTPEGYSKARQCFEQALAADSQYHAGLPWPGRVLLAERILRFPVSKRGACRRKGSGGPRPGNRRCASRGARAAGHDAGHCRLRLAGCRSGFPASFGIGRELPLCALSLCKFLFVASRAGGRSRNPDRTRVVCRSSVGAGPLGACLLYLCKKAVRSCHPSSSGRD